MAIGSIEIVGTLGKGAGSTIFKVRRASDGLFYALKVVSTDHADDVKYLDQVRNEFEIGSRLNHPCLVKVHAFEETRKFFRLKGARILLEYVDGRPLGACGMLSIPILTRIFFRAAEGLAYMHKCGVFHADIKPDNILVDEETEVKLIDFGLAWREGEQRDRVQGTLEFLAPEQASRRIVNRATDIFNFGSTMYWILGGRHTPAQFRELGANRVGGLDQLVTPLAELNPSVPAELDALVRRCVRFRPQDRPASMKEVRDELRAIGRRLKHSGALASEPRPAE